MNNLVLALVLSGSAALLWLGEWSTTQRVRAEEQELLARLESLESETMRIRGDIFEVQNRLNSHAADLAMAQLALREAENGAGSAAGPDPDPAREGVWPLARPYFHLAKHRIKDIGFPLYSGDNELTPEAVALFGLRPSERAAVEEASSEMRRQLVEFDLRSTERRDAVTDPQSPHRRQMIVRIKPFPPEMQSVREQYENAIRTTLGPERSALFLERAGEWLDAQLIRTSELTLTLSGDENRRFPNGQILYDVRFDTPSGRRTRPVVFPLTPDSELGPYRHLLEPLFSEPR